MVARLRISMRMVVRFDCIPGVDCLRLAVSLIDDIFRMRSRANYALICTANCATETDDLSALKQLRKTIFQTATNSAQTATSTSRTVDDMWVTLESSLFP